MNNEELFPGNFIIQLLVAFVLTIYINFKFTSLLLDYNNVLLYIVVYILVKLLRNNFNLDYILIISQLFNVALISVILA